MSTISELKGAAPPARTTKLNDPYLVLLKKCLTHYLWADTYRPMHRPARVSHPIAHILYPLLYPPVEWLLRKGGGLKLARHAAFDPKARENGLDWPPLGDTMIGLKRLDNLHFCVEQVLRDGVPGDFIEAGVWRGGACIFMRAALNVYGDAARRTIWVADSFEGLPKPDGRYRQDDGDTCWTMHQTLAVSLEEVRNNFAKYGLLDDRVSFLKGWFKDTLPSAPFEKLAILRLDGDMYSSTMDALNALYPKLSSGGYAIIDDYGEVESCRHAVDDYRVRESISTPLQWVDHSGVFWRKV
jgi:O-methyltransferase